tara:strand:+ start:155 stop:310 length:156 start_codon:yes stop_codon:yes gene_type:complete
MMREKAIVFFKNLILLVKKKIKFKNKPLRIPNRGALESLKIRDGIRKIIGK